MTTYPDLKNEPELLKIKTRDDEIKNSKYQTEKHDHENILKYTEKLIMKKIIHVLVIKQLIYINKIQY